MSKKRWLIGLMVCLAAMIIGGCDNLLGPDPDEIRPSDGMYIFELEYVRFQYDTGGELMTVTNLTSIRAKVWIVRYDDRGDDRSGVRFTLDGYNVRKTYHEQFPRGTKLWIEITRDGVITTGYVEFN